MRGRLMLERMQKADPRTLSEGRLSTADADRLNHDFTNIVRELNRILHRQTFDKKSLVVQNVRVQVQLLLVIAVRILKCLEHFMVNVDLQHFVRFHVLAVRHSLQHFLHLDGYFTI